MAESQTHQSRKRRAGHKGTGSDPNELSPGRHFRHLRHDEFEAVLDRREISARLICLTQSEIGEAARLFHRFHRALAPRAIPAEPAVFPAPRHAP